MNKTHKKIKGMRTQGENKDGHNKIEKRAKEGGKERERDPAPDCGCPSRPLSSFAKRSSLAGWPLLSGISPHSLPTASSCREVTST